jgi:hypothetical protein
MEVMKVIQVMKARMRLVCLPVSLTSPSSPLASPR